MNLKTQAIAMALTAWCGFAPASAQAETVAEILKPATGKVIFVRKKKAKNKNPGTKDAPMKNLDKAMAKAKEGDTIVVAGGRYKGTFGVGFWHFDKGIKLYGGFDNDFTKRDFVNTPTLLQPAEDRISKGKGEWIIRNKENTNVTGVVVDGFVFDSGFMNPYMPEKGKPEGVETGMMKVGPGSKNPTSPSLVLQGNDFVIRNNVFVNGATTAIRVILKGKGAEKLLDKAKCEIANNIIVACRMEGIMVDCGDAKPATAPVKIHHNTILFTWSRLKDFGDNGYGINIKKKVPYLIEDNIIAWSIGPGLNHQAFNPSVELYRNVFWGNKKKDLWFNPTSGTNVKITADEFEDLDLDNEENQNKILKLPVDEAYAKGVIGATYTESTDYNPDSEANRMRELLGLNKEGKITSKVTMFANRYPWKKALELFGGAEGVGAQKAE